MILQIRVPGAGEALQETFANFVDAIVMRERLDRMEQLEDIRERRLEQREREFAIEEQRRQSRMQDFLRAAVQPAPGAQFPIQTGAPAPSPEQPQGLPAGPAQQTEPETVQVQGGVQQFTRPQQASIQRLADAGTPEQDVELEGLARAGAQRTIQEGGPAQAQEAGRFLGLTAGQTRAARQEARAGEAGDAREIWNRAVRVAMGDEDVEDAPSPGEVQAAADQLGVDAQRTRQVVSELAPTATQQEERRINQTQRAVQIQALTGTLQQINAGASPQQLAASDNPMISVGVGLMGGELGTQVRQLKNIYAREDRDIRQANREFYRTQAQNIIESRGLQGQVGLNQMTAFLSGQRDQLPDDVEEALGQEVQQFRRQAQLATQTAMASNVSDMPAVQQVDQLISEILGSLEPGESVSDLGTERRKRLNTLINKKAAFAEQQLGIDRDSPDFPFPTSLKEMDDDWLSGTDVSGFQLTITPEGRRLNAFIRNGEVTTPSGEQIRADGTVETALRIARMRRQKAEEGSAEEAAAARTIQQLQRLQEMGVRDLGPPPPQ